MAEPNYSPVFAKTPVLGYAKVTTALDSTFLNPVVTLLTGGENGTRVDKFHIFAPASNSAGKIRFFLNFGSGWVPWFERFVLSTSASTTVMGWLDEFEPFATFSILPAGALLGVATLVTNDFHVTVEGGHF